MKKIFPGFGGLPDYLKAGMLIICALVIFSGKFIFFPAEGNARYFPQNERSRFQKSETLPADFSSGKDSENNRILSLAALGFWTSLFPGNRKKQRAFKNHSAKLQSLSHQAYREIFFNVPSLILLVDENLKILDANKSVEEFSGKTSKEINQELPGAVLKCIRGNKQPGCGNHPECKECPLRNAIEQTFRTEMPVTNLGAKFTISQNDTQIVLNTLISTSFLKPDDEKAVVVSVSDITKQKASEEALKQAEEKFQTFAEYTHDWEFWIAPDNTPIYHSPSCMRITGYSAKHFFENRNLFYNIIHPEDKGIWETHLQTPLYDKERRRTEFRIITRDNTVKWIEHICSQVYDNNGKFLGSRGSNKDITEKKALEMLHQAQIKLSEKSLHCSLDELLQATLDEAEILTQSRIGFFHFVEPDQKTLHLQMWSTNTIKNMCSASGKGSHYDVDMAGVWAECVYKRKPVVHNDYENLPNKKGLPEGHAPIFREMVVPVIRNNLITAIIGIGNKPINYTDSDLDIFIRLTDTVWDIVHKKRIEEELLNNNKKFRKMIETAGEGIIITDHNDLITYVNMQILELLGYSAEELQGKPFSMLTEKLQPEILEKEKSAYRKELYLKKKDGSLFPAIVASSAADDTGKEACGRLYLIADLKERIKAENEAKEQKEQLLTLINAMPDMVGFKDGEGRWILGNDFVVKAFGLEGIDYRGKKDSEIAQIRPLYKDALSICEISDENAWKAGVTTRGEEYIPTPYGTEFVFDIIKIPTFTPEGKRKGLIVVGRDITEKKQSENLLRKSEEQYRMLVENTSQVIFTMNDKGEYLFINTMGAAMLGKKPEEVIGGKMWDFFPDYIADEQFLHVRQAISTGQTVISANNSIVNGISYWFDARVKPLIKEDGTSDTVLVVLTDITENKKAEEKVRISEEKYRLIVENQYELIVKTDPEGNLLFVSPSYCDMFGKTEEELLNRSYIPLIHEDDREPTINAMRSLFIPPYSCYVEQRVYTKTGVKWIAWNDKAVFDNKGKMTMIIASGRDITEKKIAEEALRASEEKFSNAFLTSPDAININRFSDGLYININLGFSRMTGFTAEEIIGKTSYEVNIWVNHKDRDKLSEGLKKDGEYNNLEAEFRLKDGTIKTGLMSARLITLNDELCILSITRDISERKKAEELIKKSLSEKETLLRELYHRTKNNMQVINAMLTLQAGSSNNAELNEILEETANRIKAMSLVHQKLYQSNDLSRIRFDNYVRELIELLSDFYKIDTNNIDISLSLTEEHVLIDYAIPCGLVINEIVSNIFKYAFPDRRAGKVFIEMTRETDGRIKMLFKDNGIGFSGNFDYRNSQTLGLQLIVSLIEQQLDGELEIKSDEGVEIKFSFFDNQYEIRLKDVL